MHHQTEVDLTEEGFVSCKSGTSNISDTYAKARCDNTCEQIPNAMAASAMELYLAYNVISNCVNY